MKLIGQEELRLASMLGRSGVEQAAYGVDGLTALADDARHVGTASLGGENVFAVRLRMGEEYLVRVTSEPAEDEVEEFLHVPENC